ncbi:nitrate/nitrite transport system ATP-binding protein [Azospirillum lipoferum]|uniref:ATP-binding cassette domain-containing protein n=1 Tax=Azospirillum lipoferum TaxID=193 RepID=A0A5A9GBY2_AZOLI|nr:MULTISPECIES: nitrate ABC transporter ATP-binding protein [Azospirillum]KAA0591871.1 ATP-binding cassette domain-containing protein [Azospirillum lipoferum]MCP1614664.1 nitrate/nitrite transport system ATP-binding protein [Azospirillum lipoferum]MDW5537500.1 nitrate ABC transporter ATP-binding protein [Azospirillum sp. NL1]
MAILDLKGVSKSYGGTQVLRDIDLSIEEGEFVAIVGFSGSGKSTLINLIAGLAMPDAGEVLYRGKPVTGPGPERGLVFQSYSLMPWLSVKENVALAVDAVHKAKGGAERGVLTRRAVETVGLGHATDRRPKELSGGMRQRVGFARALAMSPEMLLLDEPLSALDALTRAKLQDEIEAIWRKDRKTVILITNDVDEAILLADRIIPLTPGPNATLGPAFTVDLPRPRDRTAVNHDEDFKRLRAEVTAYLMEVGVARGTGGDDGLVLPDVKPTTAAPPPKAYIEAMGGRGMEDRYLEFSRLTKTFATPKGPLTVVDGFDLKMRKGEFVSLIGHSGCGKSTVLSMVAGLADITSGGIILDGKEVDGAGPDRAVVFQAPSLFPWLTAYENVMLGVDRVFPHASKGERADIARYYLARVGLGDSMDKKASELSNGMKQRVGIARAFALSPKLLLLDEPFGMLDSLTRWELQEVLMEVWARTKVTAVCVTHDVDEALLLADRVVMMTNGPNAKIGHILSVDIPHPRTRQALLEHPRYYDYREELLNFLEGGHAGVPKKAA